MSRQPTRAEIAARLEDVRFMAETGECLDGAARRLGMSVDSLERWLMRNDRAVFSALLSRQPRDWNRLAAEVSIYELTGLGARRRERRLRRKQQLDEDGVAA